MLRIRSAMALVACALTLTSCGLFHSTQQGTVAGTVTVSGGPATLSGGPAFTGQPQQNASVVLWSDRRQVASTTTDSHGRYSLHIDPGTYFIDACGAVPPLGDPVSVQAGSTTKQDIVCSVP